SVRNTGDRDSEPQTVSFSGPAGVSISRAEATTAPLAQPLRNSAALAFAQTATPDSSGVDCTSDTCTYVVPARSEIPVTIHLVLSADAADGVMRLAWPGLPPVERPVTVAAAISDLVVASDNDDLVAGQTHSVTITAAVAP